VDGNFSTNFVSARIGLEHLQFGSDKAIGRRAGGALEVQKFCDCKLPGGPDAEFKDRYGTWEADLRAWFDVGQVGWTNILDSFNARGPLVFELEGFKRTGATRSLMKNHSGLAATAKWLVFAEGEAGFFVKYYRGSDYYNNQFESTVTQGYSPSSVMTGLTWEHGRLRNLNSRR
jgi:hypothetical protein